MVEIKILDAKGLACPEPVILAKQALEKNERIVVIVDNDTALENVTRLGKSSGCDVTSEKQSDGTYEIRLEKKAGAATTADDHGVICATMSAASGPFIIVFSENRMGRGNDELGSVLMRAFVHTIAEQDVKPDTMIFYNTGVKLAAQDSDVLDDLKKLAEDGVEMLICGTCANYFNIKDLIAVGVISNMYDIAGAMSRGGAVNCAMTKAGKDYFVILFKAVSYALKAEKLLKAAGLPHKLIPVPRHISSADCGVCLRIHKDEKEEVTAVLTGKVEMESVRPLYD